MIYMLRGKDSMPRVRHKISLVVESFAGEIGLMLLSMLLLAIFVMQMMPTVVFGGS